MGRLQWVEGFRMFENGSTVHSSHDENEGFVVLVTIDEQLDSILTAHVTRFELVSEAIPLLYAGGHGSRDQRGLCGAVWT